MSVLKGLLLYGAVLTFAGFYIYFIVQITKATGKPPGLPAAMVSVAAALAGVLGSAFAVAIGVPTDPSATNSRLARVMREDKESGKRRARTLLGRALSLEPARTDEPSWPLTLGIWAYALVGVAVAITYFLNQPQTPDSVKALAVAFAGYVLALVTAAYGVGPKAGANRQ
jgi:membrane associated rhomboid family serine protease